MYTQIASPVNAINVTLAVTDNPATLLVNQEPRGITHYYENTAAYEYAIARDARQLGAYHTSRITAPRENTKTMEFRNDEGIIGTLKVDRNKVDFVGEATDSAKQFFKIVRDLNMAYIGQIYAALGKYRDLPDREGNYSARTIIENIDCPFPVTKVEKVVL